MPQFLTAWRRYLLVAALSGCSTDPIPNTDDTSIGTTNGSTGGDAEGDAADERGTTAAGSDTSEGTMDSGTVDGGTTHAATDGGGEPAELPSDVLDLSLWKLTLPVGESEDSEDPLEILQPELESFVLEPWFMLDEAGTAVVFRAHAGGVSTSNSGYPRSELREMTSDGQELASWSTSSGRHEMTITQAITHLPEAKPHVVAGQIHDAEDDLVMIRLEGEQLFVEGGGEELGVLDDSYVLGTEFTVRIVAEAGRIDFYYDDLDTVVLSVERDADGCYFKAGAYTQSNLETGDAADAYGEVVISALTVTHTE